MIATSLRSTPAAAATAAVAVVGAVAALACSSTAHATVSDAPCDTSVQLAKTELHGKVNGKDTLLAKVYVFDEGKNLCAVTTSVDTEVDGVKKFMQISLTVGGKTETDKGRFGFYAGRIRLPDAGACFSAEGKVTLDSGVSDDNYASCAITRKKPMPR
ncbi:hypothetical protein DSM104299_00517 [Baekduia alba]|uniref:hypothetical protein n=1 Tax=Baekduia alba TaxID=2997333 RepID=UPI002340C4A1|nr:hypothetical protein [Baekduia alba]WCB91839.1 hypothetical protein DSM104299_00517 [Baekduia alba]